MKTLLIGYGNTLRGDDAIGPVVAERIERALPAGQTDVTVMICHQLTPELAEDIAQFDRVIFIDAAENLPPGEVRCVDLTDTTASPGETSHAVDPAWLLHTARILYGHAPQAHAVMIGGADFGLVEGLTDPAKAGVEQAVARIDELLEA